MTDTDRPAYPDFVADEFNLLDDAGVPADPPPERPWRWLARSRVGDVPVEAVVAATTRMAEDPAARDQLAAALAQRVYDAGLV